MKSDGRGMLCKSVQIKAKRFLGEEITTKELRLYPFIDYCVKNGGYLDRNKINFDERDILNNRIRQNHIHRTVDGHIYPTREFYDFIQDVLADCYVTFREEI